ncbi:hypothetical protein BD414DRAFT_534910 [Trametes punicea]|nr:hypothetical protein BD414DRAFT_534910 [Trametes punicea]
MQRRTSQTFQRLRKLSDSLIQAIAPSSSKNDATDSSFEHGRKGRHQPSSQTQSTSSSHRRPSHRVGHRISKEDIRYPLIPQARALDVSKGGMSTDSKKPKRPSRPREEDLPYGAQGSIPKALAPPDVPPAPAVGRSRQSGALDHGVPFPVSGRERDRDQQMKALARCEKPLPEPPRNARREERKGTERSQQGFFNPFLPASASSVQRTPERTRAAEHSSRAVGDRRMREEDAARQHPSASPVARTRQAGVRRISSSGDVRLPTQHARYRPGQADENAQPREARHRHPDLRAVRSTPLRAQDKSPPVSPPLPAQQASPLAHVVKPRPRNVPRDVSPENPQRLPTPRRSREDVRARTQTPTAARPMATLPPPPRADSVAAKAQASLRVQQSAPPKAVQMTAAPEHLRGLSMKAQVVRPRAAREAEHELRAEPVRERQRQREAQERTAREREREARRERGRARPTHTRAVEVEYYGMSEAFAQEITIALMEPERANPLPSDWKAYVATGPDYGVRPLVTKKSRLNAAAPVPGQREKEVGRR